MFIGSEGSPVMTKPNGWRPRDTSANLAWDLVQGIFEESWRRMSIRIRFNSIAWSVRASPVVGTSVSGASGRPGLAPEATLSPSERRVWLLDATEPATEGVGRCSVTRREADTPLAWSGRPPGGQRSRPLGELTAFQR